MNNVGVLGTVARVDSDINSFRSNLVFFQVSVETTAATGFHFATKMFGRVRNQKRYIINSNCPDSGN